MQEAFRRPVYAADYAADRIRALGILGNYPFEYFQHPVGIERAFAQVRLGVNSQIELPRLRRGCGIDPG